MEVTPELYAWLTELKILSAEKTFIMKKEGLILVEDEIANKFLNGFFFDRILSELESLYNSFYKIKLTYTQRLEDIKSLQENFKKNKNDKNLRSAIWKIIAQVTENFGVELNEEKIKKISNGEFPTLSDLLISIYGLTGELTKRVPDKKEKKSQSQNERYSSNKPSKDNSKDYEKENNFVVLSSKKNNLNNNSNNKNLRESINSNKNTLLNSKSNNNGLLNVKKSNDFIDLKQLDVEKELEEANSPLEFFILSLAKSLDLKPRQAAALLSNNRKYLIQISNRGIKGDFSKVMSWYQDLLLNYRKLIHIVNSSNMKDSKSMTYATLSVGLFSKNLQIAQNSHSLLIQLEADVGMDYEWLLKDGLEVLFFTIGKHKELRMDILNLLEKFSRENEKLYDEMFNVRKFGTQKIYEFISNIMDELHKCGIDFLNYFKFKIPEFCFNEKNDLSLSCAIMVDCWIKLNIFNINKKTMNNLNKNSDNESNIINNILKFLKNSVREKTNKNLQFTAVAQLFRLMKRLGEKKDENAPTVYKNLVFLFLENYDDTKIREIFLLNFSFIFEADKSIPTDILLDPYLRQLKGTNNNSSNLNVMNIPTNYDINDFKFLVKILEHPKIKIYNLKEILEFSTLISYTNLFYSRSANMIINIILDRNLSSYNDLLNSKNLNQDIIDIYDVCISYIKNALKIFLQNPKDLMILETPYDITNLNINYIIKNIEKDVIEANEKFRKEKGIFSGGLLSLLWPYEKHDDVLLTLEEKYTEKYYKPESMRTSVSKGPIESRKIDFVQSGKPQEFLKILKLKRERTLKDKEEKNIQNAIKESKFLPDSYKKFLLNSKTLGKSEQANSLLESLNLKNLLNSKNKSNSTNKIHQEDYTISKLNNIMNLSISPNKQNFSSKPLLGQPLIQPEGQKNPFLPHRDAILGKYLPVYHDYQNEGEERENIACDAFMKKYSKQLKQFFSFYVTEVNNTIIKHNLMKMFRELGIYENSLNLEELSSVIRNTFGTPLNTVSKEQFDKLIVQLAYVIYGKIKPGYTISMCLQELLKIIAYWCKTNKINSINSSTAGSVLNQNGISHVGAYNKKMYEYLKSKVEGISQRTKNLYEEENTNNLNNSLVTELNTNPNPNITKNESEENSIKGKSVKSEENFSNDNSKRRKNEILIPPGYKKMTQTEISYDYVLPNDFFSNFLSESQIICYEIINDIIKKKFSSSIIEPYVQVYNETKLIEEPLELKKRWGNQLTIPYTKLDKKYEKEGKECADVLEDILRAISLGRDSISKPKYLTDKERSIQEEKEQKEREKSELERLRKERKKEITKRLKELKNEKSLDEKQKQEQNEKDKKQKEVRMNELSKNIERKRQQMKQDVEKSKKEKEKKKEEKEKADKAKNQKKVLEIELKKKEFFKKQRRKLKEQFKEIKTEKDNYLKQQQEIINVKLPEVNIQKIIDKDREYYEFEKNLNNKIEDLLERNDIKEFLQNYENHFKLIYDFYSHVGNLKITFYHEDAIHLSEFKEFCVNFMVFGLLLTSDQINYIFKKISKRNVGTAEDLFFLRYNDFLVSIIYISIFLKISRRGNNRILQSDLDKIDIATLRNLMDFLNLKLPFNKRELEDFINDRRALSAKQLLRLQNQTKKENSEIVRTGIGSPKSKPIARNKIGEILNKEKQEKEKISKFEEMRQKEREENQKKNENEQEEEPIQDDLNSNNKKINESAKKETGKIKKIELKSNSDKNPSFIKKNNTNKK